MPRFLWGLSRGTSLVAYAISLPTQAEEVKPSAMAKLFSCSIRVPLMGGKRTRKAWSHSSEHFCTQRSRCLYGTRQLWYSQLDSKWTCTQKPWRATWSITNTQMIPDAIPCILSYKIFKHSLQLVSWSRISCPSAVQHVRVNARVIGRCYFSDSN